MHSNIKILLSLLMVLFAAAGCNNDDAVVATQEGRATLRILLTDASAPYDSVVIRFSEISANIDSVWHTVVGDTQTVDLLEWSNGKALELGSADVPAGYYAQVRLRIDDAYIGVDGEVYPMDVPSGAQTGLKFGPGFMVMEGSTYELVIDFDAMRSVVTTGPPHNPKGYKLKPHIRLSTTATTGSISGMVTPADSLPEAHAIQNGDTITTSIVDSTDGFFRLAFLPAGTYTVFIEDTSGNKYEKESVPVSAGSQTELGDITIEK
jgi:hypothetical protein